MRFRGGKVLLFSCGLALAGVLATAPAFAVVRREGTWPAADPKVTLDVTHAPREEAIRKLAAAAGWSVVVHAPSADPVDVHVKDQPAGKVLDLLLLDADYIATRDGTLVSIRRSKESAPAQAADPGKPSDPGVPNAIPDPPAPPGKGQVPVPPLPPSPPPPPVAGSASAAPSASASASAEPISPDMPADKGRDVAITGDDLKVAKKHVVHNVSVVGGDIDVYGIVTGSVHAVGGDVHIHPGARVFGGVSSMGGDVRVDDGGRIDGSVKVAGGVLERGEKAIVGGDVTGDVRALSNGDDDDDEPGAVMRGSASMAAGSKATEVGSSFVRMALLFVFGTVLLALQPDRMDQLKAELVARPMRSFAMGVLGLLGAGALFLALTVTMIGIPFALFGALALALALAASVCAVLETVGRALVRHRSQNPYVHLGLGCAVFLVATSIPWIGPVIGVIVLLLAAGILVQTRGAGLVQKAFCGSQPYRAAQV